MIADKVDCGALSFKDRINECFVPHTYFENARTRVARALAPGPGNINAPCLHISGPPGVGKTRLCSTLEKDYPIEKDGREFMISGVPYIANKIPLVQVIMPAEVTVIKLCEQLLIAFGHTSPKKQRPSGEELTNQVDKCIRACGTAGILMDEAQRLVDRQGIVVAEQLLEWFKTRHAMHGISLIFLGLGRLSYLFQQDSQIRRRWHNEIRLPPYRWRAEKASEKQMDEYYCFLGVLAKIRDDCGFKLGFDILDDKMAFRFFYASRGAIGYLIKLFYQVADILDYEGYNGSGVSEAFFELAFDEIFLTEEGMQNPFSKGFDGRMPPALGDDNELLADAETRRKRKTKSARKREITGNLTKR